MMWLEELQKHPSKIAQYFVTQTTLSPIYTVDPANGEGRIFEGTLKSLVGATENNLLLALGILAQACQKPFEQHYQSKTINITLAQTHDKKASIYFNDDLSIHFSLNDEKNIKMQVCGLSKSFHMPAQHILRDIQNNVSNCSGNYESNAKFSLSSRLSIRMKKSSASNDNNNPFANEVDDAINFGLNPLMQSFKILTMEGDDCALATTALNLGFNEDMLEKPLNAFANVMCSSFMQQALQQTVNIMASHFIQQILFDVAQQNTHTQSIALTPQRAMSI